MGKKRMAVKGQITIFVIIAIVIVAVILLLILFRLNVVLEIPIGRQVPQTPEAFLVNCIEPHVKESVELISSNGGYITPKLKREFENQEIAYLCYNQNYYLPCVNQEPLLIQHLKKEVENFIADDVENCFIEMKTEFEGQNYGVTLGAGSFEVELAPSKVSVKVDRVVQLSKTGETQRYTEFVFPVFTKFYDNAIVVQEIVSQEARFCNFEQQGYTLFYPEFDIDEFRTGDLDIIYTIKNKRTNEAFRFAIRGCTIPPGIG